MINYLDNPEFKEPDVEMHQDFLYTEIRRNNPELIGVSKREFSNDRELQERITGSRIDGTSWRDDYDFDEEKIIGSISQDSLIEEQEPIYEQDQSSFAYGGDELSETNGERLVEFKGGGTHEENSLGGIPLGIGSNGKRNSVEEGETRYDFAEGGYIFSNRIDTKGLFKDL